MCTLTVYTNAKIYTMDDSLPIANSLAISRGKIVNIGFNVEEKYLEAKVIDLDGKVVVPGFIDSHIHLTSMAELKKRINLKNVKNIEELKKVLKKHRELSNSTWIIGRGFNEEQFDEKKLPTRCDLDEAVPDRPVIIIRICGHIGVANTLALKSLGFWNMRYEEHLSQGILREKLLSEALNKIPKPSFEELKILIKNTIEELLSHGLTTVCSVSATPQEYLVLKETAKGIINVKLVPNIEYLEYFLKTANEKIEHLKIIGFKTFADGSFGGRTAALREPYNDEPGNKGLLLLKHHEIRANILKASKHGYILAVHAIGDRAIEEIVKAVKEYKALRKYLRIEHCSLTPPDIIDELIENKPYAIVVQPHFRISDWWLKDRIGSRVKWAYMFRTLLKNNFTVASSSDAPVEPFNPLINIWASISRKAIGESVSRKEALKMYTKYAAKALRETKVGVLRKGFKADFVVLNDDIFKVSSNRLKRLRVEATVVKGKIVYRRNV